MKFRVENPEMMTSDPQEIQEIDNEVLQTVCAGVLANASLVALLKRAGYSKVYAKVGFEKSLVAPITLV